MKKRSTKETYERDLEKRPTKTLNRDPPKRPKKETYKRDLQRDLQKRPTKALKRDK